MAGLEGRQHLDHGIEQIVASIDVSSHVIN